MSPAGPLAKLLFARKGGEGHPAMRAHAGFAAAHERPQDAATAGDHVLDRALRETMDNVLQHANDLLGEGANRDPATGSELDSSRWGRECSR